MVSRDGRRKGKKREGKGKERGRKGSEELNTVSLRGYKGKEEA